MAYLKYNSENITSIITNIDNVKSNLSDAKDYLSSFLTSLNSTCTNLFNKANSSIRNYEAEIESIKRNKPVTFSLDLDTSYLFYRSQINKLNTKISDIKTKYNEISSRVRTIKVNIGKIESFLLRLRKAFFLIDKFVTEFEDNNGKVVLDELENDTIHVTEAENGEKIVTFRVQVGENENGEPIYAEFTMGELLNAFYTETMSSINSVYSISVVLGEDALVSDPTIAVNAVNSSHSFVNSLASSAPHLFGIATLDGVGAVLGTAGIDEDVKNEIASEDFNFSKWLPTASGDSEWDDEKKSHYEEFLSSLTNGDFSSKASVAAGVVGAFGIVGNGLINYNKETDEFEFDSVKTVTIDDIQPSSNSTIVGGSSTSSGISGGGSGGYSYGGSGSGTSYSGSGSGNSNNGGSSKTDADKKDNKDTKSDEELKTEEKVIETVEVPEVVKTEDASKIPEKVEVDLGEKDYDQMARDALESDTTTLEAHRAEVVQEANALFDSADKTALKEKLTEYGYTEMDIDNIIADRDLTVSALLQGDYSKQLATKATELATQDNVTDFTSSYGEELCCHDFYNGEAEQLMSNMSADSGVVAAKTNLAAAESKYNEAVTAANDSIAKMNESKTNMETVKTEITTEISKSTDNWRSDIKAEYDAEVNLAKDEFVKKHGTADKWNNDQILEYTKLSDEIKTKYTTEIQADSTKWTEEQVKKYNESIEQYNTSVKEATTSIETSNAIKTEYDTAKSNLETARETFINNVKKNYKTENSVIDSDSSNEITTPTPEVGSNVGVSDQDILGSLNITGNSASLGSSTPSE